MNDATVFAAGPSLDRAVVLHTAGRLPPGSWRRGHLLGGKAEVLTRGQATERAFREAAGREPRVVHLATHTVIDERPGRGNRESQFPAL